MIGSTARESCLLKVLLALSFFVFTLRSAADGGMPNLGFIFFLSPASPDDLDRFSSMAGVEAVRFGSGSSVFNYCFFTDFPLFKFFDI